MHMAWHVILHGACSNILHSVNLHALHYYMIELCTCL